MLVQKLLAVAQVGGQFVLYILIALSVVSIGIIFDRWIYFRRRQIDTAALGSRLVDLLRKGDVAAAIKLLRETRGIEAEVVADALAWYQDGPEAVREVLDNGVRVRR